MNTPIHPVPGSGTAAAAPADGGDIAALAKGGRTNFIGFLLRLAARLPFLFIAGRIYGPEALGRFAYAILLVEFAAQLATLGLKRGLAAQLSEGRQSPEHTVWDAMLMGLIASLALASILVIFPEAMFPNSGINGLDRLLPLIIIAIAGSDIALAACAYRFNVAATVRARSIIEPWVISIAAFALSFYSLRDGLILSYVLSMLAALVASLWPMIASYGLPKGWRPNISTLYRDARRNLPLAAADAVEWGSRRLDLAILGLFATPYIVGIYYIAQQVASLPQKLKTSFDPVLGPVITRSLADKNYAAIARQVSQVGFWIIAAQTGIALALGMTGEAVMGLVGPTFVGGMAALAFLLAAEAIAATAVVSEAALIYMARHRNLMLSLSMIAIQAALTFAFILTAQALDWRDIYIAACPPAALCLALAFGSVAKAGLLSRLLAHRIDVWRWPLVWAAAAAAVTGAAFTALPQRFEWVELAIGIPAILAVYGAIIWRYGFGKDDRALFRKTG